MPDTDAKGIHGLTRLPRHIAIVMDGNGRWAQQRGLPRTAGHKAGVNAVRNAVELCGQYGVEVLTLFAFSSENWKRPQKEVSLLMDLFFSALHREVKRLNRNNVRLRIIGERTAFSTKLQERIHAAEEITAGNSGLVLQVAANYGGRWDITQAARQIAARIETGNLTSAEINEALLSEYLCFHELPDPDLFIRTGGEQRLSNFMLWQAAYTELYFTEALWPDFDAMAFSQALQSFQSRERRFGKTGEQARSETGKD
ncbi:MAG: di-trans,poly-cis-decaprenylcistransferase [Sedimenticola sp.]|nr:MAG: di-trans,poly-cis-decaprenylcistransferase [Sedimenticola sp.]